MAKLAQGEQDNVNVTLGSPATGLEEFEGKEFPCPFCGAGLPILVSIRNKPYCTCNECGVQIFVRGKLGISRLREMANTGILVSVTQTSASHGIGLYNRLEQLKLQKNDLEIKRGIIFRDENVGNAIQIIDAEIEKVQCELARIARKTERAVDSGS